MLVILYPVFQAYDFCRHPLHANIFAIAVNHKKGSLRYFCFQFFPEFPIFNLQTQDFPASIRNFHPF